MSNEVIEVEAEVIEGPTSELAVYEAEPGTPIRSNIAAVKAWVDAQLETYAVPCIEDEEGYRQAKRDRTALRKMGAAVDAERKRIKDLYTAPLAAFEAQVKEVTAPVKALDAQMKAAIDAYEAAQADSKMARLQAFYEDLAPDLALPLEGCARALVPFERIADPSWRNRGTNEVAAQNAIGVAVQRLAKMEKEVDGMGLAHAAEAKAAFWEALDPMAAFRRDRELTEQEQRQAALEAERRAREEAAAAAQAAPEPQTEPPMGVEPQQAETAAQEPPERPEAAPGVVFEEAFDVTVDYYAVTRSQMDGLVAYCRANGIHGKVRRKA